MNLFNLTAHVQASANTSRTKCKSKIINCDIRRTYVARTRTRACTAAFDNLCLNAAVRAQI